jgi:hypothetical protein
MLRAACRMGVVLAIGRYAIHEVKLTRFMVHEESLWNTKAESGVWCKLQRITLVLESQAFLTSSAVP